MASVQSKKNKSGKKTYFVVVSIGGGRKWIRAIRSNGIEDPRASVGFPAEARNCRTVGAPGSGLGLARLVKEPVDHRRA